MGYKDGDHYDDDLKVMVMAMIMWMTMMMISMMRRRRRSIIFEMRGQQEGN